jgi:hypothetical protein
MPCCLAGYYVRGDVSSGMLVKCPQDEAGTGYYREGWVSYADATVREAEGGKGTTACKGVCLCTCLQGCLCNNLQVYEGVQGCAQLGKLLLRTVRFSEPCCTVRQCIECGRGRYIFRRCTYETTNELHVVSSLA